MKKFVTLFRSDNKWEQLSVFAKTKKEAKNLVISTYEGFKKNGYIKDYKFMAIWGNK